MKNQVLQFTTLLFLIYFNAQTLNATCRIGTNEGNLNPPLNQEVNYYITGCSCFECSISTFWTISGPSFSVNGNTYYGSHSLQGAYGINITFLEQGEYTISFYMQGCEIQECNTTDHVSVVVGEVPEPQPIYPAESHVPDSLIQKWKTAGFNRDLLPKNQECFFVNQEIRLMPYRDGYLIEASDIQNLIANTNSNILSVIRFSAGHYYLEKNSQIKMNKPNIVISGAGADKTFLHIVAEKVSIFDKAVNFISLSKDNCGITCLSIDAYEAFPSSWMAKWDKHDAFKNKSMVKMSNVENCWVENVYMAAGYGTIIQIGSSKHVSVLGSKLEDTWTHGGSEGTQGYGTLIHNSDFCLVENNQIISCRHAVVIQGDEIYSTVEDKLSSHNVVAYNYTYGNYKNSHGFLFYFDNTFDITLHGVGQNRANLIEGNLSSGKIAIDDDHGSNGSDNVMYRNISRTQFTVQKVGDECSTGNQHARILLNKAFKRWSPEPMDRFKIKASGHTIRGNSKCNTSGGSCNNSQWIAGVCGIFPFQHHNHNYPITGILGQTCYLTSVPDWAEQLPAWEGNENPASLRNETEKGNCYCFEDHPSGEEPDNSKGKRGDEVPKLEIVESIDSSVSSKNLQEVTLYPNPFDNHFNLRFELNSGEKVAIKLFSMQGELIFTQTNEYAKGQHIITIDRNRIPNGLYFVVLETAEENKLIKIVAQ